MEKFTAAQARELMSSRFNVMIERIHNHIRNMAVSGGSLVTVIFSGDYNIGNLFFKVKDFLEKEGYEVILINKMKSVEFHISWCESE